MSEQQRYTKTRVFSYNPHIKKGRDARGYIQTVAVPLNYIYTFLSQGYQQLVVNLKYSTNRVYGLYNVAQSADELRDTQRKLGLFYFLSLVPRKHIITGIIFSAIVFNSALTSYVQALISTQNFTQETLAATNGVEVLAYTQYQEETISGLVEFSNLALTTTHNSDDDIIINADEELQLNHFGDNERDSANGLWWDADANVATDYEWEYRRCFTVNNTNTTVQNYAQVYQDWDTTTLITDGKLQADLDDLRFVDSFGNVLPIYIVDGENTNSTRIWFRVDNLPVGNSTVCGYYGNPTALGVSSRSSVFTYPSTEAQYYNVNDLASPSTSYVASYEPGTEVVVPNYTATLGQYSAVPTITNNEIGARTIDVTAPIYPRFTGNGGDALVPAAFVGTAYTYETSRGTNTFSIFAPDCTATVEFWGNDGTSLYQLSGSPVTANTVSAFIFNTDDNSGTGLPNNSVVIIESTNGCPIVASHIAGNNDEYVLHPADTQWLGTGTNSVEVSALQDGTVVDIVASDGYTNTVNLDRGDMFSVNRPGSQGDDPAFWITANLPIGAKSIADGDGNESTTFLPPAELGQRFIVPDDTQYVALAGLPDIPLTANLYSNSTCTGTPAQTLTDTPAAGEPTKVYFGSTTNGNNINPESCIQTTAPVHAIFEPNATEDEANMWSYRQSRPRIYPKPTFASAASQAGAYTLGDPSVTWGRRIPITITNNSANIVDELPVRIDLSGITDLFTNAQTDGGDIRVAGGVGDGTDNLPYFIETFNSAAQTGFISTQLPTLPASSSTTVYLYFDTTPAAPALTTTGDELSVYSYVNAKPVFYLLNPNPFNSETIIIHSLGAASDVTYNGNTTSVPAGGSASITPFVASDYTLDFGEAVLTSGPISGGFPLDATDSLTPLSWAGTQFALYAFREPDVFSYYAPFTDSDISLFESTATGWSLIRTDTVTAGSTLSYSQDIADGKGIRIDATAPILANHRADIYDSKLLYPVDQTYQENFGYYELFGVSSSDAYIQAYEDNTTITIYKSDGTQTTQVLNAANDFNTTTNGLGQGTGYGIRVVADKPIAGHSGADSDGLEAVTYLPRQEVDSTYVLAHNTQYVSLVGWDDTMECTLYNNDGTTRLTDTAVNNTDVYPNLLYFEDIVANNVSFEPGDYIDCDAPAYAYIEKEGYPFDTSVSDETTILTYPQARTRDINIVTSGDLDTTPEEGLYQPNGTAVEYLDLSTLPNGEHIVWDLITFTQTLPTNTDVSISIATGPAPCNTTTYSAPVIYQSGDEINISLSDAPCVEYEITLETSDRQYTPEVEEINFVYSVPELLTGIFTNPTFTFPDSTTADSRRVLKFNSIPTDLVGGELRIAHTSNTSVPGTATWAVDSVVEPSYASTNMFTWPTFPSSYIESTTFETVGANAVSIYNTHSNATGGEVSFEWSIKVPGGSQTYVSHPYTIEII